MNSRIFVPQNSLDLCCSPYANTRQQSHSVCHNIIWKIGSREKHDCYRDVWLRTILSLLIFVPQLSHDLCCSQLANTRQQPASPSLTFHNSASSGVFHKPSKTRIRWNEDLHDRFLECVNRLGGADSKWILNSISLQNRSFLLLTVITFVFQRLRRSKYSIWWTLIA